MITSDETFLRNAGINNVKVSLEVQVFDNTTKSWTFRRYDIFNVFQTLESYKNFTNNTLDGIIKELENNFSQHNNLARISVIYEQISNEMSPFSYMFKFIDYKDLLNKLLNEIQIAKSFTSQTSQVNGMVNIIIYDKTKDLRMEIPVVPNKITIFRQG